LERDILTSLWVREPAENAPARASSSAAAEFSRALARHWPEFVDCQKRLLTEAPFLESVVPRGSGLILDACAGTGCESIYLLQNGFQVVSNEIDRELRNVAAQAGRTKGVQLTLTSADWRSIGREFAEQTFRAILLMGNSLGLLGTLGEVTESLQQLYRLLMPGGCLILDQRNYDYILDDRDAILRGNFHYSRRYIYCGTSVTGRPREIDERRVVFGYYANSGAPLGTLSMIPIRKGQLGSMLTDTGYVDVTPYYDFKTSPVANYDFVTFVARRPSVEV